MRSSNWSRRWAIPSARGDPLFRVFGGTRPLSREALAGCVAVGTERTLEQDPRFAFRILVDIANKALSPAINDPTTAVLAIDQIDHLLLCLGRRRLDEGVARDPEGKLRVVYGTPDWPDYVTLAVTEIRQYGDSSLQVARRLRAMLEHLIGALPETRQPPLQQELVLLANAVVRKFPDEADRKRAGIADYQGVGGSDVAEGVDVSEFLEGLSKVAVLVFVVTCMVTAGLGLGVRDVVAPLRRARLVLLALAANFVIAPALAYGLTVALPVDRPYEIGLLLLGGAAGAPFLPKLAELAKGDVAFSVGLMLLLIVGSVIFMPLVLPHHDSRPLGGTVADPAPATVHNADPAGGRNVRQKQVGGVGGAIAAGVRRRVECQPGPVSRAANRSELLGHARHIRHGSARDRSRVRHAHHSPSAYALGGPAPTTRSVLGLGTGQRNIAAALLDRDGELLRHARRGGHAPGHDPCRADPASPCGEVVCPPLRRAGAPESRRCGSCRPRTGTSRHENRGAIRARVTAQSVRRSEDYQMPIRKDIIDLFRVPPDKKLRLKDHNPGWKQTEEFKDFGKDAIKERAKQVLEQNLVDLAEAQTLLYADDRYSVLIVLQAMDAAGKDGTIKHVMSGREPAGLPGLQLQEAISRGTRSQLPVAIHEEPSGARADRHLQPLLLRGRPGSQGPPRVARPACCPPEKHGEEVLGGALRGHQRLRTTPGAQRDA